MDIQYIIYINEQDAIDLINQINTCMGWPDDKGNITWEETPDDMCEFDLTTGQKINIGYGVMITNQIINCLTPIQQSEILTLPSNINTCSWQPTI